MSKQQHTPPETVLRLAREAGGITYRNRAVQGAAIAFGPVALERFVSALHEESTRDLLTTLRYIRGHFDTDEYAYELADAAIKRAEGKE